MTATRDSPLTAMGPSFLSFDESGSIGRFTINYEEVIYVVSGRLTLTVYNGDKDAPSTVRAAEGDVVTIGAGSEIDYTGTQGTKLFVVFSPLNWDELIEPTEN
jgi:ethanolamine utilization protein EutQ (cupin superfamily)